jgi:hypothetical protein
MAKEQSRRQLVFAVSKNGRRDDQSIPYDPADRMTACINLRADVFNNNASASIGGRQWHAVPQKKAPLPRIRSQERLSCPHIER